MRRFRPRSFVRPAGVALAWAASLALTVSSPARAQVASALLTEGAALTDVPGHTVSSLNNTAVNHGAGFAVSANSSDGTTTLSHVWGNAAGGPGATMRTEGTFGPLVQTAYESFYGMSNTGNVAYSATGTGGPAGGFDSVWLDDSPIAVEGDPYPHAANFWWSFGSRPGVTADGTIYWVGGITDVLGGSTDNRGLFYGPGATPLLIGGDLLPNLPAAISMVTSISFDYRFSALGTHYIGEVDMDGATATDAAIVMSGAGLLVDGALVQEGTPLPAAAGGLPGELWGLFDFVGVTESGDWMLTGDSNAATAVDEFIMKNGVVIYREGDVVDSQTLSGALEGGYMNEDGDIAYVWDIAGGALEALFFNDQLLLTEGDFVDFDNDGVVEPTSILTDFTGISTLTVSDRDLGGGVNVYFTADVVTPSGTLEGFFCLRVETGPTPIRLSGLEAIADPRAPRVTVQWSTSSEVDHDGFLVYRSKTIGGEYARLTEGLVRGRSPYTYVDDSVQRSTTYFYKIGALDLGGHEELYGPVEVRTAGLGIGTELAFSRPNPFTDRTRISFSLARDSQARIDLFDVSGRRVATLVDAELPAGEHAYWWDGSLANGGRSTGGVYFYRLEADGVSRTQKLVHLNER